jgi:hypothetical protein
MPASIGAAVAAAEKEWRTWGKSRWNCITGAKSAGFHIDDDDRWAQYILDTYMPPFRKAPITSPTKTELAEDIYPWSAVAISNFMLQGGFLRKKPVAETVSPASYRAWVASSTKDEFPIAEGHSVYLRWAIRARRDGVAAARFWGYRVDEPDATPEVGDIVGCTRSKNMTAAKALAHFDRTASYSSHADLVVARRPGEIDVIGGNVRDSVTRKTLALNSAGQLADTNHFWFVVMKHRP